MEDHTETFIGEIEPLLGELQRICFRDKIPMIAIVAVSPSPLADNGIRFHGWASNHIGLEPQFVTAAEDLLEKST